jgi:hypothetical protein
MNTRTLLTIKDWVLNETNHLILFQDKWLAEHRDADPNYTLTSEEWAATYKEWRDDPRHA